MNKKGIIRIVIIFIVIAALLLGAWGIGKEDLGRIFDSIFPGSSTSNGRDDDATVVAEGELEIHFLELGNKYTGDCTYIKAGDKDILIDAGSKASSIETIDA